MQFKCQVCNTEVIWKYDEYKTKNRMFEVGREIWHECEPKPTTIVHIKRLDWYCWDCGKNINLNSPCLHYQKLKQDERAIIRYGANKK